MSMVVLSPVPAQQSYELDPGPSLDRLDGASVGFRVEFIWPAYHVLVAEWTRLLHERGARTKTWSSDTQLPVSAGFDNFVAESDFAVVGLGNCGSCTSWAIHDTVGVLNAGKGAVGVVTAEFSTLAEQVAARAGWPAMRLLVLPYPLVTLSEAELRGIANEYFGGLLRTCGLSV